MQDGEGTRTSVAAAQIALEDKHLEVLYRRLDAVRVEVEQRLANARRDPITGTPGSRSERDALVSMHEQRLAVLNGVDDRLCFGRLDMADEATRYVGRIGLADAASNPLLMDWRADAAGVFYQATAANPQDVVRRRHIATTARRVTGVDDDILIMDALTDATRDTVTGHDSLLTALDAARTGHMRDIVSTIQAEQDRIIRSEMRGVVVVQGGPGTGKTVVALHRVAYLLYAHRDRIARSGALIVGPNRGFLEYIDRVLPALGETGVLMRTVGQLYPGIETSLHDSPAVAVLKGDIRMADLIKAGVRARQRFPAAPIELRVDSSTVALLPTDVAGAMRRARDSRKPYNEARSVFVKDLLNRLAGRLAKTLRINMDDDSRVDLTADLRDSRDVRREVNLCWMPVTPEQFVRDLFADPIRLAALGNWLSESDVADLVRPGDSPWTISDISLLDEAAELLGEYDPASGAATAADAAQRKLDVAYAREVLSGSGPAAKMMTAEQLADRYASTESLAPTAERAAADRQWIFGHVVVDEAQEVSAMEWRMLMRRCPSRSMTIVGDPAQTSSAAGVGSWNDALWPYVQDRWRIEQLTINYRTPALIMRVAGDVLVAGGIHDTPPNSVREGEWAPLAVDLAAPHAPTLADLVAFERNLIMHGTIALVCDESVRELAQDAVTLAMSATTNNTDVDVEVRVCSVSDVKGLEFDSVLLFDPSRIVDNSIRAPQDLYVAITRPTQRLVVAHSGSLPDLLVIPQDLAH